MEVQRVGLVHQHHGMFVRNRLAGDAAVARIGGGAAVQRQEYTDAYDRRGRGAQDRDRAPGLGLAAHLRRAKSPLTTTRDATAVTDH